VSVAATETLYAVAGGTGYTDSSVGSAAYTIGAGGTPSPVGTPVCGHNGAGAISLSYTPYAAGDALVIVWSAFSNTVTLSSITDNGSSGGSSYTIISGLTGQHGGSRSLQLAYTLALAPSVTTITIGSSSSNVTACVQEFANVSGIANATGGQLTSTGTYTTSTTPQCTIANSTDYVFLGGLASYQATTVTPTNGTSTTNMAYTYTSSSFTWEHYALNAHPYGSVNYASGNPSLACVDVQ
jgi:hypothetical protein